MPAALEQVEEAGFVAAEVAPEIGAFDIAIDQAAQGLWVREFEGVDGEDVEPLGPCGVQEADQIGAKRAFLIKRQKHDAAAIIGGFDMDFGLLPQGAQALPFGLRGDDHARRGVETDSVNVRNEFEHYASNLKRFCWAG